MDLGHYLPTVYRTWLDASWHCVVFDYKANTNRVLACVCHHKIGIEMPLVVSQISIQMPLVANPPPRLFNFLARYSRVLSAL